MTTFALRTAIVLAIVSFLGLMAQGCGSEPAGMMATPPPGPGPGPGASLVGAWGLVVDRGVTPAQTWTTTVTFGSDGTWTKNAQGSVYAGTWTIDQDGRVVTISVGMLVWSDVAQISAGALTLTVVGSNADDGTYQRVQ